MCATPSASNVMCGWTNVSMRELTPASDAINRQPSMVEDELLRVQQRPENIFELFRSLLLVGRLRRERLRLGIARLSRERAQIEVVHDVGRRTIFLDEFLDHAALLDFQMHGLAVDELQ